MILIGCISEEVYDGFRVVFYLCVCTEVSLYVYLHEDVDIYGGNEAVFFVVCLGACIQYQSKRGCYTFIELYGVV